MSEINITGQSFPLAHIHLKNGEKMHIETGSMVFKTPEIQLQTRLNASGSGIGKFFKAAGRALTSGESLFVTEANAHGDGILAIAPPTPGEIKILEVGGSNQYRINDGAFLALDGSTSYKMETQSLGKAIFSRTGGFWIMKTEGQGRLLINSFGSIHKVHLNNESLTVDNGHVVAWSTSLDYHLGFDNSFFQSIGTGEGLVNTFTGTGDIYIQSLNIESFAGQLKPYFPTTSSNTGSSSSRNKGGGLDVGDILGMF